MASTISSSMSGCSSGGSYRTRKAATSRKSCDCRRSKSRRNSMRTPASRCCRRTTMAGGWSRALASHEQSAGQSISIRRFVPQQTVQIDLPRAGQPRRAFRIPHSGHSTVANYALQTWQVRHTSTILGTTRRLLQRTTPGADPRTVPLAVASNESSVFEQSVDSSVAVTINDYCTDSYRPSFGVEETDDVGRRAGFLRRTSVRSGS